MSCFDGVQQANDFILRTDAEVQAKCDPKAGWERKGGKCVRKKKSYKEGIIHGVAGTLGTQAALSFGAGALTAAALNEEMRREAERGRGGV